MKKMRVKSLFLAAVMLVSTLAGAVGAVAEEEKDVMQVGIQYDASSLDPQMIGGMTSMSININMFDMLVYRDENGDLAPSLATEWAAIDDVTWQFKIREDAFFTNGEQVNAEAVKFSIDRLLNPETKSPIVELANVVSVDVVDEFTVNIVTDAPDPILPNKLTLFGGVIVPPKYYSENDAEFLSQNPVGSGPYKLVKWEKDSYIELEANPDHWRGAPEIETLIFRIIPDMASLMAALKAGDVDMVQKVSADLAIQFEGDENFEIIETDSITTKFINMDANVAPFDNPLVRQAMNYAIDRQTIVDSLHSGLAKLNATLVPDGVFGYDESVEGYSYDPEKAKELLAEAGYPDGFEFTFAADETMLTEIQAICAYLEAVGIKANLNVCSSNTIQTNLAEGKCDPVYMISNTGWTMDAFNYVQTFVHSGRRHCRMNDAELDALVEKEEQNTDETIRQEAFTEIQKQLVEKAYFIGLWQTKNLTVINSDFTFTPNEIGILWMYTAKPAA